MFYFYTNELHFAPEFLGRSQLVGSLASRAPGMKIQTTGATPSRNEHLKCRVFPFSNQKRSHLANKKHPTGNIYVELQLISWGLAGIVLYNRQGVLDGFRWGERRKPGFQIKRLRVFWGGNTWGVFSKSWVLKKEVQNHLVLNLVPFCRCKYDSFLCAKWCDFCLWSDAPAIPFIQKWKGGINKWLIGDLGFKSGCP